MKITKLRSKAQAASFHTWAMRVLASEGVITVRPLNKDFFVLLGRESAPSTYLSMAKDESTALLRAALALKEAEAAILERLRDPDMIAEMKTNGLAKPLLKALDA